MLEANKSYALESKCPLLKTIVLDYLIEINRHHDIYVGTSLYEKSIKISDTAEPSSRAIVISQVPRNSDNITNINLDETIVDLVFEMNAIDPNENKDNIRLIKQKTKRLDPLLRYYKVLAILGTQPITHESINKALEYDYRGVHTTSEIIEVLVEFISHPSEINLQRLVRVVSFKEGYQRLLNCIGMLVNDPPEWVTQKYKAMLDSANFIRSLLKITLISLRSETTDEFILQVLKDIIYS